MIRIPNDVLEDLEYLLPLNYYRVLIADLNTDEFQVLFSYRDIETRKLSEFLAEIYEHVDEADKENFKTCLMTEDIKNLVDDIGIDFIYTHHFSRGNTSLVELIVLPLVGYTEENRECIIFFKIIEKGV